MPVSVNTIGTAEALSTVELRAQITGQLSEVGFAEGDEVRAGQLLFALDARPFEAAVQQAQAILAKDNAQAVNAQAQRVRSEDLMERGIIARNDYETAVATASALQATVEADKAAIETARLNLAYTRIVAPVSGRTGALMVHPGDLIRANDTTPMVVINQIAPIAVTFAVPGDLLDEVRRHQAAAPLTVSATPKGAQTAAEGKVSFIDNQVDRQTGTIKVKGTFANADRRLWPGLFADVALRLKTDPRAVVAPAAAVQTGQQGQYVYVVKDDQTVELRPVTVARTNGDEAVIGSGLKGGETIVLDGQLRLTPGAKVTAKTAAH